MCDHSRSHPSDEMALESAVAMGAEHDHTSLEHIDSLDDPFQVGASSTATREAMNPASVARAAA